MASPDWVTVRCHRNRYNTALFSFDMKGIYIRCKDCRNTYPPHKRGQFHLYTWREVMSMFLGLWRQPENAFLVNDTGSADNEVEGGLDVGSGGDESDYGSGDQGGSVVGNEVQLSAGESRNLEPEADEQRELSR